MERKQKAFGVIDAHQEELIELSDRIFDHPEIGLQEYQACQWLTDYLERNGFAVERGVGGMETAFRAVYQQGNGGPSFGLLCEYDALEKQGHACGHHLQGPCIIGAAMAIQQAVKDKPYRLVVYGTPAEENYSGKITMIQNGCFQDIDIALMMHMDGTTRVDVKSLANIKYSVIFHGVSAHAGRRPEDGKSALDGLLLSFQGIEFMREHVIDDVRMHYTVVDAGGPANVVPARAEGSFVLRSYGDSNVMKFDIVSNTFEIEKRHWSVMAAFVAGIVVMIFGCIKYGWSLSTTSIVFIWLALVAGLIYGYTPSQICEYFVKGSKNMVNSALLVGIGAAAAIMLDDAHALDTVVMSLSSSLNVLPQILRGPAMFIMNMIINFFISSASGQAAVVMPIFTPVSDLVGVSRQSSVLAFKLGDSLSNYVYPNVSSTMGFIGAAGITYDKWMKFMGKLFLIWVLISVVLMMVCQVIGYA
mgnify:CR=1 FL=1